MSTEVTEKPVDIKANGQEVDAKPNEASSEVVKELPKESAKDATDTVNSDQKPDRMPNTGHLVEVNGKILHYERVGTGKIPVLLMPGLMGSSRSDFPEQLGEKDYPIFQITGRFSCLLILFVQKQI